MNQENHKHRGMLYLLLHNKSEVDRCNNGCLFFLDKSPLCLCNREAAVCELDREPAEMESGQEIAYFYLDAVRGDHIAEAVLGAFYYEGVRVKQDYKEAFHWCLKAAEYGIGMDESMYLVGRMYELGKGVEKDSAKAVDWYLKAAAQENVLAITRLSELL